MGLRQIFPVQTKRTLFTKRCARERAFQPRSEEGQVNLPRGCETALSYRTRQSDVIAPIYLPEKIIARFTVGKECFVNIAGRKFDRAND